MDPLTFQSGKTNATDEKPANSDAPAVPSAAAEPITPDTNPLAAEPVEAPAPADPTPATPNPALKVVPAPPEPGQDPQAPVATTAVPAPGMPKDNRMMMIGGIVLVVLVLAGLVFLLA